MAKSPPAFFLKALYRGRTRIELTFGKFKRFKRITLRCDKTAKSFGSFVALALSSILIKSAHTVWQGTSRSGSATKRREV